MSGVARAAGYPDYTHDGTSKFIPELWSTRLVTKYYKSTCFSEIANTNWEGEIKKVGDVVKIRTLPSITINDYSKGQKLTYENPESTPVELEINKAKYWAFNADDIDAFQSDLALLDQWADDAAKQLKITIEQGMFQDSTIYDGGDTYNKGNTAGADSQAISLGASGSPLQITKSNILDVLVDVGVVLDEQNIPEDGRWIVLPPWMAGMLKKSDLKDASLTGDASSPLRTGAIGSIDKLDLYVNRNLYSVTDGTAGVTCWYVIFGHKEALTFATQIVKTDTLRAQDTFGDLVRGLQVYGYKVVEDNGIGALYVRR